MNKPLSALLFVAALMPTVGFAQQEKLKKVFAPDMLGASLAYFELQSGPAWKIRGDDRIYKVVGCEVTAKVSRDEVKSLRMALNPKCSFDVNGFLPNHSGKLPAANRLTFGNFDAFTNMGGRYYSDCLSYCGNAYDPSVFEHWQGSRSDNSVEALIEVVLVSGPALDASQTWAEAMTEQRGRRWVEEGRFNCADTTFNHDAQSAFRNIRITAITIGYDIKPRFCD